MTGFAMMVIQDIQEVELEIALNRAPSNMSLEAQIDQEMFNFVPPDMDYKPKQTIRHLLKLLHDENNCYSITKIRNENNSKIQNQLSQNLQDCLDSL